MQIKGNEWIGIFCFLKYNLLKIIWKNIFDSEIITHFFLILILNQINQQFDYLNIA